MNLKIRKIKKESSSGISTKPKEKKQNIKLKVIKNVKPEKTERIYKTEVNADAMSTDQLRMELMAGYDELQAGNVYDAGEAFAGFRDAHR